MMVSSSLHQLVRAPFKTGFPCFPEAIRLLCPTTRMENWQSFNDAFVRMVLVYLPTKLGHLWGKCW